MYTVFVTGGLASGKKTVCELLHSWGATYLDADVIAKEEQTSPPILAQLIETFGNDICNYAQKDNYAQMDKLFDGQPVAINRPLLAARAFASPEAAAKLNAICWPPVRERLADLLVGGSCQKRLGSDFVVVEIPLLAESATNDSTSMLHLADEIVCVSANESIRRERAIRRGMPAYDCDNRLTLQATDEQRERLSDTVFYNNGSLKALEQQVRSWYDERSSRLFST